MLRDKRGRQQGYALCARFVRVPMGAISLCRIFMEIQKTKTADPRWPPFGNHQVITRHMTSLLLVMDRKGNVFQRAIYPPSLIVIVYILAYEVIERQSSPFLPFPTPPPHPQKGLKHISAGPRPSLTEMKRKK